MDEHYICTGGCGGVSETPGVCQDPSCPKYGKPLDKCDCKDGNHEHHERREDSEPEKSS